MNRIIAVFILLIATFIDPIYAEKNTVEPDPFPVYPVIQKNVDFWKTIYSKYPTNQGLIHDADNLAVVYKVVQLVPVTNRRTRTRNRNLIKNTKSKYAKILRSLAIDLKPENEEERRILGMFGKSVSSETLHKAATSIRFQRGQKDRFINGVIRSGKYLDEIKKNFRDHNIPEDLAYLPHVESSFNYNAYSKFGAAGIWQFTYGTGKRFMKVDYVVDERWDPLIASIAAAKLLKNNHQILNSWPLALTAYNHGAKAMMRAKRQLGDYERIFLEYDGRRFKFASRNFYSEFLAAREIAKNYRQYFGELKLHPRDTTFTFKTENFVAAEDIASHFNIKQDDIQQLNKSLRKPVFLGQKFIPKGYILHLPTNSKNENLVASFPKDLYKAEQKRSQFYYVRKGDVAGAIARRHGITLDDLIRANNLNRRATIYAGQNLRIPGPNDKPLVVAKEVETTAIENTAAVRPPRQTVSTEKLKALGDKLSASQINPTIVSGNFLIERQFSRNGADFGTILVETGETLGHYAEWSKVSAQYIRNLNNLSFSQGIHMGQTLVIPLKYVSKGLFEEQRYEFHKEFEEDFLGAYKIENTTQYTIKRGDNIWSVCTEKLGLPVWLVKKYNYGINFNRLMPGQKVTVPVIEIDEANESYETSEE